MEGLSSAGPTLSSFIQYQSFIFCKNLCQFSSNVVNKLKFFYFRVWCRILSHERLTVSDRILLWRCQMKPGEALTRPSCIYDRIKVLFGMTGLLLRQENWLARTTLTTCLTPLSGAQWPGMLVVIIGQGVIHQGLPSSPPTKASLCAPHSTMAWNLAAHHGHGKVKQDDTNTDEGPSCAYFSFRG